MFEFYRNGRMYGRISAMSAVSAKVAVDGDTLLITTRNPRTHADETIQHRIVRLDQHNLTLEDARKVTIRMERAEED